MKERVNNLMEFAILKLDDGNGELDKALNSREFRQVPIEEKRTVFRKTQKK